MKAARGMGDILLFWGGHWVTGGNLTVLHRFPSPRLTYCTFSRKGAVAQFSDRIKALLLIHQIDVICGHTQTHRETRMVGERERLGERVNKEQYALTHAELGALHRYSCDTAPADCILIPSAH